MSRVCLLQVLRLVTVYKLISIKNAFVVFTLKCICLQEMCRGLVSLKIQKTQLLGGEHREGPKPRELIYKLVFLNGESAPPLMVK